MKAVLLLAVILSGCAVHRTTQDEWRHYIRSRACHAFPGSGRDPDRNCSRN